MILLFVFFLSGLLFAFRTAEKLRLQRLIDRAYMTKIGTVYVLTVLILVIALPTQFSVIILFSFHIAISALPRMIMYWRNRNFKRAFLQILDQIILGMSAGLSFRQSFEQAKFRWNPVIQQKLTELLGHVAFSQHAPPISLNSFLAKVIEELSIVDQQPHRALQRLQCLRDRLKIEENFRRRSGQVTQQLRAQSVILSILYLFLLIFVGFEFGLHRYLGMTLISLFLFFVGTILVLNVGKRFRWKI